MGNSSSKKRKDWASGQGSSTDVEPRGRDFSPWRKGRSEPPLQTDSGGCLMDVPSKPGKAVVTLTHLQSDKPSGSCVTDSIYLDWNTPLADGGRPVLGYIVEMYDLPTGNWVTVTQTEGDGCRSVLDNILCGIMYRFRVRAFNEIGNSIPGIPSDAFVIDAPGVHIAPYFILCPPPEAVRMVHDTVQFRVKALGTPRPSILWQKDDDPIFVTEGIEILEESDGSVLTVHNLQLEDHGVIQCVAVNRVGKAVASTDLLVICIPQFASPSPACPGQFTFRAEEMIRLKFPLKSNPPPTVQLLRNSLPVAAAEGEVTYRDGAAIVRMGSARVEHTGEYSVTADNGHGRDQVTFIIDVEVPPDPPGQPEVLDVTHTGQLSLCWEAPQGQEVDHYIVEYYRDQWQLWLRMKTCLDTDTVINDLIPGSKYKFRVMSASIAGISQPSPETEEVMIGVAAEDELFDLPRGRQQGRRGAGGLPRGRNMPSLDRNSLDRSLGARSSQTAASPDVNRRHVSLDREVYYDSENIRRDVVAFKPETRPEVERLGHLSGKYKLSNDEMSKYKTSMSQLCHKMKMVSNTGLPHSNRGSRTSVDALHHLKLEVTNTVRNSLSLTQLTQNRAGGHIDRGSPPLSTSQCHSPTRRLSSDMGECRQSLTDIRDRIGSLQSLLKTSRDLTASKQKLFDLPTYLPAAPAAALPPATALLEVTSLAKRKASRSDSYSQAMDAEEGQYQETHFPYTPEDGGEPGSTTLLCDMPENRQSGLCPSLVASPNAKRNSTFLTDTVEEEAGEEARQDILQPDEVETLGEERADRPESTMSCQTITLCDSSITEMVDTDNTAGRDRLISMSSQGTLVASDSELLDDEEEEEEDGFEL